MLFVVWSRRQQWLLQRLRGITMLMFQAMSTTLQAINHQALKYTLKEGAKILIAQIIWCIWILAHPTTWEMNLSLSIVEQGIMGNGHTSHHQKTHYLVFQLLHHFPILDPYHTLHPRYVLIFYFFFTNIWTCKQGSVT